MDNNYDSDSDNENISLNESYYDSDVEDLYVSNTKCNISKNVDENLNNKYIKRGGNTKNKNKYKFVITIILGISMLLILLYIYKIHNYK